MSFTLTTSGAAMAKAGANASTDVTGDGADMTILNKWSDDAESFLVEATRKDLVTDYAKLTTSQAGIASEAVSSMIAKQMVNYDTSGFFPGEAQLILNVQDDIVRECTKIIKDFKTVRSVD